LSASGKQRQPVGGNPGGVVQRLLWFAALWLAGVAAVGALAFVIRTVLV
jgi:hypothetical protein